MVGVGESIEDGGRMGNRESGRVTRKKNCEGSLQLAASQMGFNGWAVWPVSVACLHARAWRAGSVVP
jgi:hypothetical protein